MSFRPGPEAGYSAKTQQSATASTASAREARTSAARFRAASPRFAKKSAGLAVNTKNGSATAERARIPRKLGVDQPRVVEELGPRRELARDRRGRART